LSDFRGLLVATPNYGGKDKYTVYFVWSRDAMPWEEWQWQVNIRDNPPKVYNTVQEMIKSLSG